MSALRGCAAALMLLALSACVSVPARKEVATASLSGAALDAANARQVAREARLRALPSLAFSGRVALSNGRNGGSGRIEWTQSGGDYTVTLSAPVTRQSWKLSGTPTAARIDGIEGGAREDSDATRLLHEATGLDIPVGALAAWASGARASETMFGAARLQFDAGGTLARIEQGGWTIDYLAWQDGDGTGAPIRVPSRIDARRDQASVRLAIDTWSWQPGQP